MVHKALLLLRKLPKNRITTYKALAKACKTSPRAIGCIMRHNKKPGKYPCYKVIKSDGSIGGYCGDTKGVSIQKKIRLIRKDGIEVRNGKVDKKYLRVFR